MHLVSDLVAIRKLCILFSIDTLIMYSGLFGQVIFADSTELGCHKNELKIAPGLLNLKAETDLRAKQLRWKKQMSPYLRKGNARMLLLNINTYSRLRIRNGPLKEEVRDNANGIVSF